MKEHHTAFYFKFCFEILSKGLWRLKRILLFIFEILLHCIHIRKLVYLYEETSH